MAVSLSVTKASLQAQTNSQSLTIEPIDCQEDIENEELGATGHHNSAAKSVKIILACEKDDLSQSTVKYAQCYIFIKLLVSYPRLEVVGSFASIV